MSEPTEPSHDVERDHTGALSTIGRRGLVGGLALGGVAVGGGALGAVGSRVIAPSPFRTVQLSVEVACLGATWREMPPSFRADDTEFRAAFLVEGWIYPAGTIPGDGFIPTEEGSIGRWFCKGHGIIAADRSEPHISSHQDFLFGVMTPDQPFPADMISTSGIEGTGETHLVCPRAVIGGTGAYFAALGSQRERFMGPNSTLLQGTQDPAANFAMEFDLRLID